MSILDAERFAKVLALASSNMDGEALAALRKANAMLQSAGMSFIDIAERLKEGRPAAVHYEHTASPPQAPTFADIFAGYDDRMEEKQPGWKAKQAAERAERDRKRVEFRKGVLEKYGSEEAALAPCWREQALRRALGPLVVDRDEPWSRWADNVGGLGYCGDFSGFERVPPQVKVAIETAYPLPTTVQEAHAEHEAWREREREMDAALNWNSGDTALDLVGYARMERVRMLLETELPARDWADVLFRSRYYRGLEFQCDRIEGAIHNDIERLVREFGPASGQVGAHPSNPNTVQSEHPRSTSARRRAVIEFLSNPDTSELSDREIARRVGVSPSTVGNLRRRHSKQGDLFATSSTGGVA